MTILLALAPFGFFALLTLLTTITTSMFGTATVCLAVIVCDIARGRTIKTLAAACGTLCVAIGGYVSLIDPDFSLSHAKLTIDCSVLAIALVSLAIRRPFTLQYAREMVDTETATLPGFMRANYIITWAWTASFLLMAVANILLIYVPSLPLWSGIAIAFAARNSAVYFTKWYPQHRELHDKQARSAVMPSVS